MSIELISTFLCQWSEAERWEEWVTNHDYIGYVVVQVDFQVLSGAIVTSQYIACDS